jgi:hypothetical protein
LILVFCHFLEKSKKYLLFINVCRFSAFNSAPAFRVLFFNIRKKIFCVFPVRLISIERKYLLPVRTVFHSLFFAFAKGLHPGQAVIRLLVQVFIIFLVLSAQTQPPLLSVFLVEARPPPARPHKNTDFHPRPSDKSPCFYFSSKSSIAQPSTLEILYKLSALALLMSFCRCSYSWMERRPTPDFFASSACEQP